MATKRKPEEAAEEPMLENEEIVEKAEDKDAIIEKLKAELEYAKMRGPADVGGDKEMVRRMCEECAEKGIDPWTVKVRVRVPRRPDREDPWYWINVNGIAAQIPANDKYQELKLPWAEILMSQLKAEDDVRDFTDNIQVYDPVTNPHPQG